MKLNSFKNLLLIEVYAWFEAFVGFIPGRIGKYGRSFIYGLLFKEFRNKKFTIGEHCHIWFPWFLKIGKNSHISRNCQINTPLKNDISIGSDVMVGPYCMITSITHNFEDIDTPIKKQGLSSKPIMINDNVWIGGHCVILPGVTIGEGSIIAANSVVTKDVAPYSIVAGIPAKLISTRK